MNNTILEKVLDLSSHSSNPNPGDANSAKIEGKYIIRNEIRVFIHDSYHNKWLDVEVFSQMSFAKSFP